MALDDKILKKVFNANKKVFADSAFLKRSHDNEEPYKEVIREEDKPLAHYRVFDGPAKGNSNIGQNWDKLRTNTGNRNSSHLCGFKSLVGLQKKITFFLYNACKESRDKSTAPISISHLAESCHTTIMSAQKTIQRLENKKIIKRTEFKIGRGGWTRYELPDEIYHEMLLYESQDKFRTTSFVNTNLSNETKLLDKRINDKTSNTIDESLLPTEWLDIDYSPLNEIGFKQEHIIQLYNLQKHTPKTIQDSINYFAFDLKFNKKADEINKSPVGYFMGILRKSGIYIPPDNYESPEDRILRELTNRRKEAEMKRINYVKEIYSLAVQEWMSGLSDADIEALYKNTSGKNLPKNGRDSGFVVGVLKNIFAKNIWEEKRKQYGINTIEANLALK